MARKRILVYEMSNFLSFRNSASLPVRLHEVNCVQVDVRKKITKIFVTINMPTFKASLKQHTTVFIFCIEIHRVPRANLVHKFCEAALIFLPQHQMKVVRHKTISYHVNERFICLLSRKYFHKGP